MRILVITSLLIAGCGDAGHSDRTTRSIAGYDVIMKTVSHEGHEYVVLNGKCLVHSASCPCKEKHEDAEPR